jgi:hypothetical protein
MAELAHESQRQGIVVVVLIGAYKQLAKQLETRMNKPFWNLKPPGI